MSVDLEKLKAAMLCIASHPSVSALGLTKLYKLVYFADARHLRETGVSITGSEFIKYQHGPVPSRGEKAVKQLRKDGAIDADREDYAGYETTAISVRGKPDLRALAPAEKATLAAVCRELGAMTATQLSALSHDEPAWISAPMRQKLAPDLIMYGAAEDPEGL